MGRTCGFAGSRSFRHDVRTIRPIVGIIPFAGPERISRGLRRSLQVCRPGTQLLPKSHRIELTVLHALTAGNAFLLIHFRDVIGSDRIRRMEIGRDTQRKAGAAAAVADCRTVVISRRHVQFMDKPVVFGALQDLIGLLLADQPVGPRLRVVDRVVVQVHAHVLFQVPAAFSHQSPCAPAGTWSDGDRPCVLDEFCHFVITRFPRIVFDGALHGNYPHQIHPYIHKRRKHGDTNPGICFKTLAQNRVTITLFPVGQHTLHDAGNPDRVVPALLPVYGTGTNYPGRFQFPQLLKRKIQVSFCPVRNLRSGSVCLQTHVHHNLTHVVVHNRFKDLIFRIFIGNPGIGQTFQADFCCQLQDIWSVRHSILPSLIGFCCWLYLLMNILT